MSTAPIYFVAVCGGCGYVFEPAYTVEAGEIPICRSCRRDGIDAAECEQCHEYKVIDLEDGLCDDCFDTARTA